jgi:hypothetical protein
VYPSTPEDIKTVIRSEEMSSCLHATDFSFHSEEKEVSMTLHPQTCANKIDAQD